MSIIFSNGEIKANTTCFGQTNQNNIFGIIDPNHSFHKLKSYFAQCPQKQPMTAKRCHLVFSAFSTLSEPFAMLLGYIFYADEKYLILNAAHA